MVEKGQILYGVFVALLALLGVAIAIVILLGAIALVMA